MANGVGITEGVGKILATLEKVWSWGTQHQQLIGIADETTTNIAVVDATKALKVNPTGMGTAIKQSGVTVPNGAATTLLSSALTNRRTMIIFNESDTTIRVGASNVATSGANMGLAIPSGQSLSMDLADTVVVYVIHAAGVGKTVSVLEIS